MADTAVLQASAPRLVLASGSAARRALLHAAGLAFEVAVPDVDEPAVKAAIRADGGTVEQAALALATMKAATVADPDCLAIGCDQILLCDTTWFDKPASLDAARHQLNVLRGRTHALVTAVVVMRGGERIWKHIATPRLTMRAFSGAFLEAYLAAEGEALFTSVGAYRLERLGVHLFDAVEGEQSAILGLPLLPLLGFFRQCGVLPG